MAGSVGTIKLPLQSTFDPAGVVAAKAALKDLQSAQGGGGGGGGGAPDWQQDLYHPSGGPSKQQLYQSLYNPSGQAAPAYQKGPPGVPVQKAPEPPAVPKGYFERLEKMKAEGTRVYEETRTPQEKYAARVGKLNSLLKEGTINEETHGRAMKAAAEILPQKSGFFGGLGGAGRQVGGMVGGEAGGIASLLFSPTGLSIGTATAAVALSQRFADNAIDIRKTSERLGTSTQFYTGLSAAARRTHVDMGAVEEGIEHLRGKALGAITGDYAAKQFFSGLGMSREQLESGLENADQLVNTVATRGGVSREAFGSNAPSIARVLGAGPGGAGTMSAGVRAELESTKADFAGIGAGAQSLWGQARLGMRGWGAFIGSGFSNQAARDAIGGAEQDAREQEKATQRGRVRDAYRQAAAKQLPGLLNAGETRASEKSDIEAIRKSGGYAPNNPEANDAFAFRAQLQSAGRQFEANRDLMSNRNQMDTELQLARGKRYATGYSSDSAENTNMFGRDAGNKLTDYAESITRSGSLAGAYDANSVAGYSQMVGSEYQMDQSKDTMKMVELLVKIAENTGKLGKGEGDAIIGNLGYRTRDPILGGN
jgi:hypothetical protein